MDGRLIPRRVATVAVVVAALLLFWVAYAASRSEPQNIVGSPSSPAAGGRESATAAGPDVTRPSEATPRQGASTEPSTGSGSDSGGGFGEGSGSGTGSGSGSGVGPGSATETEEPSERPTRRAWALLPIGDQSPTANESMYEGLRAGTCSGILQQLTGWANQSGAHGFATGRRTLFEFKAGAHLCLGDESGAEDAYQRGRQEQWNDARSDLPGAKSRACAMHDAVEASLGVPATACTIQVESPSPPPETSTVSGES